MRVDWTDYGRGQRATERARTDRAAGKYRGSLDRLNRCAQLARTPRAVYLLAMLSDAVERRAMADAERAWEEAITTVYALEVERDRRDEKQVAP